MLSDFDKVGKNIVGKGKNTASTYIPTMFSKAICFESSKLLDCSVKNLEKIDTSMLKALILQTPKSNVQL